MPTFLYVHTKLEGRGKYRCDALAFVKRCPADNVMRPDHDLSLDDAYRSPAMFLNLAELGADAKPIELPIVVAADLLASGVYVGVVMW